MAKFVWSETLKCMVDKADGTLCNPDKDSWVPEAPVLMLDIGEFRSPIDGKLISSRSQLAEHNRRHGVIQVGNDLMGAVDRNKAKRERKREAGMKAGWK